MIARHDREDYTAQEQAVTDAKAALVQALSDLAGEAALVAKALGRKRPPANLVDGVRSEFRHVERCEEALDLAVLDLRTARGEDA